MAATFKFDTIRGAVVDNSSTDGRTIIRTAIVKGIELSEGASDPNVLLKVLTLPGFPQLGDAYPDEGVYAKNAVLRRHRIKSVDRFNDLVIVEISYFQPNLVWSITDSSSLSVVQSFATCDGTNSTTLWYKAGTPKTVVTTGSQKTGAPGVILAGAGYPPDANPKTEPVRRYVPQRTLRARTYVLQDDWDSIKDAVHLVTGMINNDSWGTGTTRGQWLFLGPTTSTTEPFADFPLLTLEYNFLYERAGHYPITFYRDRSGGHPFDCATENDLRGGAPGTGTNLPTMGGVLGRNGIAMFSEQFEASFSLLFGTAHGQLLGFDPSGPIAPPTP